MDSIKQRESNFELLRILAMIMIIAHHFAYHSDMTFDTSVITLNRLWQQLLMFGGHIGLNAFVLISGYFMIDKIGLDLSKIARIWLMMFFYSVTVYLASIPLGAMKFWPKVIKETLFPINLGTWGFASAYFMLLIFSPFINVLLRSLSKNQYRVMLAVMLIFWSVIPTFTSFGFLSNYFLWLVVVYSIAGYIKLYPEDFSRGKSFYLKWMLIIWGLTYASAIVLDIAGFKIEVCARYATHFSGMQHINIVLTAVCMFMVFKDTNIGYSRVINRIAGTTFGIYLIHDDYFINDYLWQNLFKNPALVDNKWLILISVGEIFLVFTVGMVIEYLRQILLERLYMKGIKKMLAKPQSLVDDLLSENLGADDI